MDTLLKPTAWIIRDTNASQEEINGDQFLRLMHAAHGKNDSVTFFYEGDYRFVGPERLTKSGRDALGYTFQGAFAYRSDGALLLDSFLRPLDTSSALRRNTVAIFNGKRETLFRVPDAKSPKPRTQEGAGYEGLHRSASPLMILYHVYFNTLDSVEGLDYQFLGWETVDGRKCLHVQLNQIPGLPAGQSPYRRFWIDLERGAHPLKVEQYQRETLQARISTRLAEVSHPDGAIAWFPHSGEVDYYGWQAETFSYPVVHETCLIVPTSIQFNQTLPDALFSVAGADHIFRKPELEATRTAFVKTPPPPAPKTDPASIQRHLDEQLAKADAQAKQLEASTPARQVGSWTQAIQVAFGLLGVILIGGAILWKFRNS